MNQPLFTLLLYFIGLGFPITIILLAIINAKTHPLRPAHMTPEQQKEYQKFAKSIHAKHADARLKSNELFGRVSPITLRNGNEH